MVFQMFRGLSRCISRNPTIASCLMLLLTWLTFLFNPATVCSQSSVIALPSKSTNAVAVSGGAVPNSISSAQASTEEILSRSMGTIGISIDARLPAKKIFEPLGVPIFFDMNLEGVFELKDFLDVKAGTSIFASLNQALKAIDSTWIVESDGSILVISIDDEHEPDYLRNVTYDVTKITGSLINARNLCNSVQNTICSDSWENNGGGNGTLSIYELNNRILITANQSYNIQLAIRKHFQTVANLGGSVIASPNIRTNKTFSSTSAPSSVVDVPFNQTTSAHRSRRGFARPDSGTFGGLGGGGLSGGVF